MRDFRSELEGESQLKRSVQQTQQQGEASVVAKLGAYRTFLAIGVVALVFILVIVLGFTAGNSTTGGVQAPGTVRKTPRALVLVMEELTYGQMLNALQYSKAPNIAALAGNGMLIPISPASTLGDTTPTDPSDANILSQIVSLLTGLPAAEHGIQSAAQLTTLPNVAQSFSQVIKTMFQKETVLIGPSTNLFTQVSSSAADGQCALGVFTADCGQVTCNPTDTQCNTMGRNIFPDASVCAASDAIKKIMDPVRQNSFDVNYNPTAATFFDDFFNLVGNGAANQLTSSLFLAFSDAIITPSSPIAAGLDANPDSRNVKIYLQNVNSVYLIDAVLGRLFEFLGTRTAGTYETWLLIVTSVVSPPPSGTPASDLNSPFLFMMGVADGQYLKLRPLAQQSLQPATSAPTSTSQGNGTNVTMPAATTATTIQPPSVLDISATILEWFTTDPSGVIPVAAPVVNVSAGLPTATNPDGSTIPPLVSQPKIGGRGSVRGICSSGMNLLTSCT